MFVGKSLLALCAIQFAFASCAKKQCKPDSDITDLMHAGDPIGEEVSLDDVNVYVAEPKGKASDIAILYLTDVFGIQLAENKLLVDSFSRAGFLTVAPDLFAGEPAPSDLNEPGWDIAAFLAANGPEAVDPRIAAALTYLREELGATKVAVAGYCFGGRYAFRVGAADADAVFAAHPSSLLDEEILAVAVPAAVAASEVDSMLTATRRAEIEVLLQQAAVPYQLTLYGGTSHGFAVRANVSDPEQKFGKEEAFFQAVRWFNAWA